MCIGLVRDTLQNVSSGKLYTGKSLWDAWLEARKEMVKLHAVFCHLYPSGKPPSGNQWSDALQKFCQALYIKQKESKAAAKAAKADKTNAEVCMKSYSLSYPTLAYPTLLPSMNPILALYL